MGRDIPDRGRPGGDGGPGLSRPLPPGGVPPNRRRRPGVHRDHPARADRRLRCADRASGRRALSAAVRHDSAISDLRRRAAGAGARGRRARQGCRHRHVLHLRRPDRRDLVAGAAAAGPGDHRAGRPNPSRAAGLDSRPLRVGGDRRQDHLLRPGVRGDDAPQHRRPGRRAGTRRRARPTSTRRATSRWRSSRPASGTSATAAAIPSSSRPSWPAARNWPGCRRT